MVSVTLLYSADAYKMKSDARWEIFLFLGYNCSYLAINALLFVGYLSALVGFLYTLYISCLLNQSTTNNKTDLNRCICFQQIVEIDVMYIFCEGMVIRK